MIIQIKLGAISGNIYLLKNKDSYVLVDTGLKSKRALIQKKLEEYGCKKGMLKCILLTHGDFDHCGNAKYLSEKYDCPIIIHKDDSVVLEKGNMFINRKKENRFVSYLVKLFMGIEPFSPDCYIEDMQQLNEYDMDAFVIHTPGHSPGSITIITSEKDCICGDLFENFKKPQINTMIDDETEIKKSVKKVLQYNVQTIYPGHGDVFNVNDITTNSII